jgi:hypothetical protein
MVVVCGEGFQQEITFVWSRVPLRPVSMSNRKAPIHLHPRKPELRNSNWAQVAPLLREAEVYAAHNRKREATYI